MAVVLCIPDDAQRVLCYPRRRPQPRARRAPAPSPQSIRLSRSLASAFWGRANLDLTRRRARRLGRRHEDGEITDVAGELHETHLLIAHTSKLAAQEVRPRAVLPDR